MFSVLLLYWISSSGQFVKGGFNRNFVSTPFELVFSLDLVTDNLNFAGSGHSTIYIHNVEHPYQVIELNTDQHFDTLYLDGTRYSQIRYGQVQVDSPFFFLADLERYQVFRGRLTSGKIERVMEGPNFFSEFLPLNDTTIAYRTFMPSGKEYRLVIERGTNLVDGTGLIQKQIDGLFCTDGVLRFDPANNMLIYLYFYRNQFIKANEQLRLIDRSNTIDTNRVAKIAVTHHERENYTSLSAPPKLVNLGARIRQNMLFVHSNVMADNEELDQFNTTDVFDVYDLLSGSYQHSFYIARPGNVKITHFDFFEDKMAVIRGRKLEVYEPVAAPMD